MDRYQRKRSHGRERPPVGCAPKVSNISDRRFGINPVVAERAPGEGKKKIQNWKDASKLESDSSYYSGVNTEEHLFVTESSQSSLNKSGGTPIKKLLAEELSKEMEPRRRPTSVIGRLMGLDSLPSQQPVHKSQKRFSENYLQRTASTGVKEKRPSEGFFFRKSFKEQQEFKDVFEVIETSKSERQNNDSSVTKATTNLDVIESKMAFVRQKFMVAKRLSTDQKLQYSKEFHDALEVLDSNKDLLLKFLQEPDSLFAKHLQDLQGGEPNFTFDHVAALKSSNVLSCENTMCMSEKKVEQNDAINPVWKHENGIGQAHVGHGVHISHKLLNSQSDGKDETCLVPTRIVVLKPNLGKTQNAARSSSAPCSSEIFQSDRRKQKELLSSQSREFVEISRRRRTSNDVKLFSHSSRDPREIANEITQDVKHNVRKCSIRMSRSRFRGYAGDESSCEMSGNDSDNDSEVGTLMSRNFHDWKSISSPSSSYSTESSVSREAKKRLSERWRMTHRFQEVGLVGRGSTLGEMLAMPEREIKPTNWNSMAGHSGPSDRISRKKGGETLGSPLGISSRDGWKSEFAGNLMRSRSLPSSSTVFGSPKTSIRNGALVNDRYMSRREAISVMNKSRKGLNKKDGIFHNNSRSSSKKSQSLCTDRENSHTVQENHSRPGEPKNSLKDIVVSEEKPIKIESPAESSAYESLTTDIVTVVEPDAVLSSESPQVVLHEPTHLFASQKDGGLSACDSTPKEALIRFPNEVPVPTHCLVPEPESPVSSKEVDQPSPVSVLEAPFIEEISSGSDCFERVSADLHGLRMQLELLKLESTESYMDGMVVSSDEDTKEGSVGLAETKDGELMGISRSGGSRDFCYLVDVMAGSGFCNVDRETVFATWHSPECPVDPLLFEKLEKKYNGHASWLRSDRRLIFDRINAGLIEIFRLCMDLYPWVKKVRRRVDVQEALEEELWKFLGNEAKEGSGGDPAEKDLRKEVNWMELGDDIDIIGGEVERLLIDELVAEVVSM